jgi:hypothetical protein
MKKNWKRKCYSALAIVPNSVYMQLISLDSIRLGHQFSCPDISLLHFTS